MKWEMEVDEVEVVLEKIWDLHDSISDAIHAISRAHFLRSVRGAAKGGDEKKGAAAAAEAGAGGGGDDGAKSGFVFVKGFKLEGEEEVAAVAEARSLNAIRTALEDFEEQLEFFHDLVPCVLVTFEKEQIVVWRGKNYSSSTEQNSEYIRSG